MRDGPADDVAEALEQVLPESNDADVEGRRRNRVHRVQGGGTVLEMERQKVAPHLLGQLPGAADDDEHGHCGPKLRPSHDATDSR